MGARLGDLDAVAMLVVGCASHADEIEKLEGDLELLNDARPQFSRAPSQFRVRARHDPGIGGIRALSPCHDRTLSQSLKNWFGPKTHQKRPNLLSHLQGTCYHDCRDQT